MNTNIRHLSFSHAYVFHHIYWFHRNLPKLQAISVEYFILNLQEMQWKSKTLVILHFRIISSYYLQKPDLCESDNEVCVRLIRSSFPISRLPWKLSCKLSQPVKALKASRKSETDPFLKSIFRTFIHLKFKFRIFLHASKTYFSIMILMGYNKVLIEWSTAYFSWNCFYVMCDVCDVWRSQFSFTYT